LEAAKGLLAVIQFKQNAEFVTLAVPSW